MDAHASKLGDLWGRQRRPLSGSSHSRGRVQGLGGRLLLGSRGGGGSSLGLGSGLSSSLGGGDGRDSGRLLSLLLGLLGLLCLSLTLQTVSFYL